jgi:hypothetical protein
MATLPLGYYFRIVNPVTNFIGQNVSLVSSGVTGFADPNTVNGTAADWLGSQGLDSVTGVQANFVFEHLYDLNVDERLQVTLLGELAIGPTAPTFQTIGMFVPTTELQRMFVYDSGWGPTGGTAAPYGIGGATGVTGGQTGMFGGNGKTYGPNVALLLQYVLSAVNVSSGLTSNSGLINVSNRLAGIDGLFSVTNLTCPQKGVQEPYNYWGITGPTGPLGGATAIQGYTAGPTGYFFDDTLTPIAQFPFMLGLSGATSYTFNSNSLLNIIPAESIKSIVKLGRNTPVLGGPTGVLNDIDTTFKTYREPLTNLFEQAVAFGRADDNLPQTVSSMGALPMGNSTPWQTGSRIYGVDFKVGDTLSLFLKYGLGSRRQYGIDPTVAATIPGFTNSPVYSLTFNGKTFNIPVGIRDPTPSPYGNAYNMDSPENIANERANESIDYIIELRLIATDPSLESVFDY